MPDFIRTKQFNKDFTRLPHYLQERFYQRLDIFIKNPLDPILKKHKLHGDYSQSFSINITGDYRLIFKYRSNNLIELQRIGTHSQLYK